MDTLNIGGNEGDRFYRYKMPKLISKIEGKGNGIKTVVPNMTDIARSLSRPPTYPTKFFGCELGAQVNCDEKKDRYIVNGAHEAARLQELLDIIIGKNANTQKVIRDCKACGRRTEVDMRHKLVTYILKHPPSTPKGKDGKKDRKNKKNEKNGNESPTSPTRDSAESDDEITKRIVAEAAELPIADKNAKDDDWAVDTSPEAVAKRIKDLERDVRTSLIVDDDDSEGEQEPHESFDEWLEDNNDARNNDVYKKIKELGISKDTDIVLKHLVLHLFPENFQKNDNIEKQIQKRAKLFKKFVLNPDDQLALLGATEKLLNEHKGLMESKTVCKILMGYYQSDLVEEEVIQAWIEGSNSSKYKRLFKRNASVTYADEAINQDIRNKAKPFSNSIVSIE
ncbi:11336_t:CDS:2 [Funneliformis geosporum]|uniref:11336_t:CDS:1 n=1 Tax=Funneliformis geosporum TaxID=1117311 RepID=A0A9W4SCW2_9GLOM|nr:11336_t:CDS:2 [Funneliformis geosporum]